MHSHTVAFEDGTSGAANTKTQVPYYKVGDAMQYTITEDNPRYGKKLKIEKVQGGATAPSLAPDHQPDYAQPSVGTPVSPLPHVNGPTAGMGVKTALEILTKNKGDEEITQCICSTAFWQAVYETASDIIRVMQTIEGGRLAKSVKERNSGVVAGRPKPGPGGSVAPSTAMDDVPF